MSTVESSVSSYTDQCTESAAVACSDDNHSSPSCTLPMTDTGVYSGKRVPDTAFAATDTVS